MDEMPRHIKVVQAAGVRGFRSRAHFPKDVEKT